MSEGQESDEALLAAVREGELAAFDRLYARYERRVFGYMRRMVADRDLAEDLFQDVFLAVLRDKNYDPARGRFSAWLFTVARNRCLQEIRQQQGRDAKADQVAETVRTGDDPEQRLGSADRVRTALGGLSPAQQQLLVLKQVGELTYREIADIHGVAEGTIKSRLHAATKAFRQRLAEIGEG